MHSHRPHMLTRSVINPSACLPFLHTTRRSPRTCVVCRVPTDHGARTQAGSAASYSKETRKTKWRNGINDTPLLHYVLNILSTVLCGVRLGKS